MEVPVETYRDLPEEALASCEVPPICLEVQSNPQHEACTIRALSALRQCNGQIDQIRETQEEGDDAS